MQQEPISGTTEWTKYSLVLTIDKDAKKLLFGSYVIGTGIAWLDDFNIEEPIAATTPPTKEVTKYFRELTMLVKNNSIYKDSLDWPTIDEDITTLSKGMKTIDDTKAVKDYILQKLRRAGDNHSFFQSKVSAQKYASENTNPEKTTSRLLENNIGYIAVPGFGSINQQVMNDFANDIQNQIRKLDTENSITGWVVDLRNNTGGNMYPMIAGLGPIIGDGTLGYFISFSGKNKRFAPWSYNYKNGSGLGINIGTAYHLKNTASKVAVLIGPKTSSSGEMTTISFIGHTNTKLFGQPSGGYTTGNAMFKLSDGSALLLASSYTADRNKNEYKGKIQPDILVKPIAGEDATLSSAQKWLLEK